MLNLQSVLLYLNRVNWHVGSTGDIVNYYRLKLLITKIFEKKNILDLLYAFQYSHRLANVT